MSIGPSGDVRCSAFAPASSVRVVADLSAPGGGADCAKLTGAAKADAHATATPISAPSGTSRRGEAFDRRAAKTCTGGRQPFMLPMRQQPFPIDSRDQKEARDESRAKLWTTLATRSSAS